MWEKKRKGRHSFKLLRSVGRMRHHPSAHQSYHILLQAVLWLLQRKMHSGKRDLCFSKKRGVAQSVAFPGWSFQFLSFPIVVRRGKFAWCFNKLVHLLEYCLCSSCWAVSGTWNVVICIRKVAEWCLQTCWNVPLYSRHWEQAVLVVKP